MTMRITQSAMARSLLANIASANARLARAQEELATGRRLIRASDDPAGTAMVVAGRVGVGKIDQFLRNIERTLSALGTVDASLAEVSGMLTSAKEIALQSVNATVTDADREAAAVQVEAMLERLAQIGNAFDGGRYLFAGHRTQEAPYVLAEDGALYRGDSGGVSVRIDALDEVPSLLPGTRAFRAVPAEVGASADLDPDIWDFTPLADLNRGEGVVLWQIEITDSDGTTAAVNLVGATTVRDVLDRINAAGLALRAEINAEGDGIALRDLGSGTSITVSEVGDGIAAAGLGILGSFTGDVEGSDLDPAVSASTPLSLLRSGLGVLPARIRIDHEIDGRVLSAEVDLSFARTVGDVLVGISRAATVEGESLGVTAAIDPSGAGLVVRSTIPGTRLTVSDASGSTSAAQLGIAGSAAARDLFAILDGLRDALRADDVTEIERSVGLLDEGLTENLEVRAQIGARVQRIEATQETLEGRRVAAQGAISDIEDVDLAEALVRSNQEQVALQASLTAASRTISMSLMDFLR